MRPHWMPAASKIEVQLPVRAMLQVAPLLLLFAFFVSSVLTGISSLAALSIAAIGMSLWLLSRESLHLSETGSAWTNLRGLLLSSKGSR